MNLFVQNTAVLKSLEVFQWLIQQPLKMSVLRSASCAFMASVRLIPLSQPRPLLFYTATIKSFQRTSYLQKY